MKTLELDHFIPDEVIIDEQLMDVREKIMNFSVVQIRTQLWRRVGE